MENKRGSGIFLGVVSVATLVVTIIGATFAYFSVSLTSEEDIVDLTAYEFTAAIESVTRVYPEAPAEGASDPLLVPFDYDKIVNGTQYMAHALNGATKPCVDDKGNLVCALYKVTFTNTGTTDMELNAEIKTVSNTAGSGGSEFTDLKAQAVTFADGKYSLKSGAPVSTLGATAAALTSSETTHVVPAGTATAGADFYFVVWLDEIDDEKGIDGKKDQSAQMGAKYTGSIVFNSVTGATGTISGTFNLGSSEEGA